MNAAINQLRLYLQLLVATMLLVLLPVFGVVPHAAAQDDHSMHTPQRSTVDVDCAIACAKTVGIPPSEVTLTEAEINAPDPASPESGPYYQQFQIRSTPKILGPATAFSTLPSRPPDIVKMSGHFLF